jgi:1-acyl-sn-glycerol-3-phosphate acyltransferase
MEISNCQEMPSVFTRWPKWWIRRLMKAGTVLYATYAWLLFIAILLATSISILCMPDLASRRSIARHAARFLCTLTGIHLSAHGLETLPARPHVLVVNHTSFLDGIILTALLPCFPGYSFAVRREFRQQSILCPLLRSLDALVYTSDGSSHHANVARTTERLQNGDRLVIFPEGRICPQPGLLPFHTGPFAAAAQAGVPVVTAALIGTRQALRLKSWMLHRVPIALEIGATLYPKSANTQDILTLSTKARQVMLPLAGEPDMESVLG